MSILQDVRFALRQLRKAPTFTLVAMLTLGLAVAANTVVFSVVNAILIRPLPYPDAGRLVRIDTQFPTQHLDKFWVSGPEYLALSRDARSFESVGAWTTDSFNLTGSDQPLAVTTADASSTLLPTLGVAPLLGRYFDASEDTPGDPRAIVIGYGLWQRAFGADANVVGRTVGIDGIPVKVVGVMPKGFDFPVAGTDAWVPLRLNPATTRPGNHYLTLTARLKSGVGVEAARAELGALAVSWHEANPKAHVISPEDHPMILERLYDDVVGNVRLALLTLEAAVFFVLLIACANISNLLLARAEARSGEIAIRAGLGATRGRLIQQFLTESVVLGLLGAGVGVVLAVWGLDGTIALLPEGVPRAAEIALDPTILAFAVGISLFASLLFGIAPIVHARGNLGETARHAAQRATSSAKKQLLRRALVVVEVGLAIVLVAGAGLMVRSFSRLQQVNLGFDPTHVVTLDVQLPRRSYPTDDDVLNFWKRVREGAAALPGVKSATLMYGLPPQRDINANDFEIVGRPMSRAHDAPPLGIDYWQSAVDDFESTMGMRVVRGRPIQRTDEANAPGVVLVNEAFARKFFPGEEVLGKRIVVSPGALPGQPDPQQTIVGVVADVKNGGIDGPAGTEVFIPLRQMPQLGFAPRAMHLVVRTEGDPRALFGTLRTFIGSLDPNLPIAYLRTMDRVVSDVIAKPRFVTALLATFAGIALLMAAIGIYGVMAYTVEQRTAELGIRMALGADAGRLQSMLVKQGLALAGAGVGLGLVAAGGVSLGLERWLAHLLFEVGSLDPATYAIVITVTVGIAGVACYVPARRATRIHPMAAMRHE
ncbi:MAG TPA: ABC transporter permease [Polyangiaceae bacterium]|jgi:putative ABC transport system permease protein